MSDIDKIMQMLDCNNDKEVQQKGIELAKDIKSINIFMRPMHPKCYMNVWENCAKILVKKTDEELEPYIEQLLEWIENINWPGTQLIIKRLKEFSRISYTFKISFIKCMEIANITNNDMWLSNLAELVDNKKIKNKLSKDILEILKKYKSIETKEEININNIDEVLELLDWNNDIEIQKRGIKIAKNIKNIDVFMQPIHNEYSKNVWENCAVVLSKKTDNELNPYLKQLLEWIEDINWPGALIIIERLKQFLDIEKLSIEISKCVNIANVSNNSIWLSSMSELIENKRIKD